MFYEPCEVPPSSSLLFGERDVGYSIERMLNRKYFLIPLVDSRTNTCICGLQKDVRAKVTRCCPEGQRTYRTIQACVVSGH
jgi:hypothetical protein